MLLRQAGPLVAGLWRAWRAYDNVAGAGWQTTDLVRVSGMILRLLKQTGVSCSCVTEVWRQWGRVQGAGICRRRDSLRDRHVSLFWRY